MNTWKNEERMNDAKYTRIQKLNCIAGLTWYEEAAEVHIRLNV